MPIAAYWCRACAEIVRADHWQPWGCRSLPPGLIRSIENHAAGRPDGWSVTEIKGCLREKVIMATRPVTVDPYNFLKAELGSAWDAWITRDEGGKVRWRGTLGGMEISGEPDGWHDDDYYGGEMVPRVIWDYKNGKPPRKGVWDEHRWQVSVYAWLSDAEFDYGVIYYNAYADDKATGRKFDLIRSEQELLGFKVGEDGLTVAGNIALIEANGDRAQAYPLTGKSIKFGKLTACDYCAVREECAAIEGSVDI